MTVCIVSYNADLVLCEEIKKKKKKIKPQQILRGQCVTEVSIYLFEHHQSCIERLQVGDAQVKIINYYLLNNTDRR